MEINITRLLNTNLFPISHSEAEGGKNAGAETWSAAMQAAKDSFSFLDTPEKLQAMRDFARSSGGWEAEEIDAWTPQELNAIFLQWVSADVRESPAALEGITISERNPGEWFRENEDFEWGPYEHRHEAYQDGIDFSRPPRANSLEEIDWPEYELDGGSLFKGDDGSIYFYLGE